MNYQQHCNRPCDEVSDGALRTSWDSTPVTDAMQASWFTCSVNEEDFIDNIQPNLITASLTGSLSSNITADDTCVGIQKVSQPYCDNHNDLPLDVAKSIADSNESVVETIHNTTVGYLSRPESPKSKLSLSMHDISTIPSFPLTSKSSNFSTSTIQSQSMTTDASLPKSKDSGFPRSLSCQSLSSGRSYAHVQSKVKEYIRQIKEENSGRKAHNSSRSHIEQEPANTVDESVSVKKLMPIIDKLKDELDDKDKMIIKLQENYDALLTRYAAAETRIDHFRINSLDCDTESSFTYSTPDCKKLKVPANPNLLLIPELQEVLHDSHSDIEGSYTKKSSKHSPSLSKSNSKVLNPITTFYSSSMRLDKLGSQPSLTKLDSEDLGCTPLKDEPFKLSNRQTSSSTLIDRSDLDTRNRIHKSSSSIFKELSPERLNNQLAENPFIKVQRWQESLPSFELIEPSSYGSLNTNKSEPLSDSYLANKSSDHCHHASSSSSHVESASNKGNSSTKNLSNYILSRSISQPNYAQINFKTKCSLDQSPRQGCVTEPHSITRSFSLKVVEDANCRTKQGTQPLPLISSGRHRTLGLTECSHLSRKKLVGQKARLVLFEYLKNSSCNGNLYNISKNPKVLERLSSVKSDKNVLKGEVNSYESSYDDSDMSLVNCLDEMNQYAQHLKGKSEAIIQVLDKQLKDS